MRFEMEPGPQVFRMHSEYGVAKVFQTGVPEDEPYRIVLISIRRRLYKTKQVMDKLYMGEITMAEANDDPDVYHSKQELLAPLSVMYNSLVQARGLHTPSALPPSIFPAALRPNRFPLPSSPPPLAAHVYPILSSPPPFPCSFSSAFFRIPHATSISTLTSTPPALPTLAPPAGRRRHPGAGHSARRDSARQHLRDRSHPPRLQAGVRSPLRGAG